MFGSMYGLKGDERARRPRHFFLVSTVSLGLAFLEGGIDRWIVWCARAALLVGQMQPFIVVVLVGNGVVPTAVVVPGSSHGRK